MRVFHVDDRAVALRFAGELPARGELAPLIGRVLRERGLDPWPETEAECFAAGGEVLVFARPGRARPRAFRFSDLEALLAAVRAFPGAGGALYDAGDGYLLTAMPDEPCGALYEFGEASRLTPERACHLREQGRCLIDTGAAEALRRLFDAD